MAKPKVPNTISDKKWFSIQKGAAKSESMLMPDAATRRRQAAYKAVKKNPGSN